MLGQMQDAAEDAVDSALHGPPGDSTQYNIGGQDSNNYQEQGTPYVQHRQVTENQGMPAGYHHQAMRQDQNNLWPRATGTQCKTPGLCS